MAARLALPTTLLPSTNRLFPTKTAISAPAASCFYPIRPASPHLGISAGKEGKIYLVNRDHLGKFQSDNDSQIVQSIPDALGTTPDDRNFSSAVYWNGGVYFVGNTDAIKQFQLNSGLLSTSPVSQSSHQFGYTGTSSISANGSGNGILWTMDAGGR